MKIKQIIFFFIFFSVLPRAYSQIFNEIELHKKLGLANSDSARFMVLRLYCKSSHSSADSNLKYAQMALELSMKTGSRYLNTYALELIGDAYWYANNNLRASEYYFKELDLAEKLKWKNMLGRAYYNIGWMKCIQRNNFKERGYLLSALKLFEESGDTISILEVYNGLAGLYSVESNKSPDLIDSANYYFRNLIYFSERRGRYSIVVHYNYANFLNKLGKFRESKNYLSRCIKEAKAHSDSSGYSVSTMIMASALLLEDSLDKSMKLLSEVLPYLKRERNPENLTDAYHILSDIYYGQKKYKEAADNLKLYKLYADTSWTGQSESSLLESETAYEIEKRETNIRQLEQQNEISAIKNRQNKYVIVGLLFIGGLVIFIAINLFRSNKAKQEANRALNEKNQMIEEQKKKVEERNLDITNSINYAKRIQEAILPAKDLKYKLFPDAFVLFQPKDIVSGDFYWFAEKSGRRIISAIDCTGHGVPGAFMSMIGNTFLNEAIYEKGLTKPSLILDDLRDQVISSLKQTDVIDSTKDGMDMALLSFNDEKNIVEYAGANNPLWLIRNGECIEYKADKRPIGYYRGLGLPFTNTEIELKKGDALYIFTDGFADQFGGSDGKKFKYRPLKDLLISIQNLDMLKQEQLLIRKFNEWKGDLEQVDDVCIIGIRV